MSNKWIYFLSFILVFTIFLWSQTGPFQDRSSPEYNAWLKEHNLELDRVKKHQALILSSDFKFDKLEYIEVSPGPRYYSWWGHCMIRLVGSGGANPENDLAISFLADFNDFPLNKLKASFGGYTVLVKVDTMAQFKIDYGKKENRTFDFYDLRTSTEQNKKFLEVLRLWITKPESPGTYSFFFKNCVGLMNQILFDSGILKSKGIYGYFTRFTKYAYQNAGILSDRVGGYEFKENP